MSSQFNRGGVESQDKNCSKECFLNYCGYYHRRNEDSLTHTSSPTKDSIYTSLAKFEIYETFVNAGYRSYINPAAEAKKLVMMGQYALLDGKEIEDHYKDDFVLVNKYVDKYYPKDTIIPKI